MRIGFLAGTLIAVALGIPAGARAADPPALGLGDFLLQPPSRPRHMALPQSTAPQATATTQVSGLPTLSLRGWNKAHGRPSIQIALVLDKSADPAGLAPLAIDGPKAVATWKHEIDMLDQPIEGTSGQIRRTSMDLLDLDDQKLLRLLGHDNSLRKPAVYGLDESGLRLVFYVLESWTDARGDFRFGLQDLDRTADKFAQPGRLRIWLLDDEKPIWSDTVEWPGKREKLPAPKPAEPVRSDINVAPPQISPGAGLVMPVVPKAPPPDSPPPRPANPAPPPNAPAPQPVAPPAPLDIKAMTVDQLVDHIEKTWGPQMAPRVRRAWQGGVFYFYKTQNPPADRLSIFMDIVRSCYWETAGPQHDAFLVLYVKLKQRQPAVKQ